MAAMSYESSWNDPATWETSMAWHSVERSMSTIFKRAYESYRQILQPTVLYMYSMDFHGIPGTSPGGFCWSSPVRQLGPGRWFPYTSTGHLGVSPCKLPTGCSGDLSFESADSDWCRIGMSGHRSCPTKRSSES